MRLAKWQGLGNDYLIVEPSTLPGPLTPEAIGLLCDRHRGVGSDGILVHEAPSGAVAEAVARMRIFNPDGSEPEMCGNGIRMFARYLVQRAVVSDDDRGFVVETLAGPIKPRLLADGRVRVDMGAARFNTANFDSAGLMGGHDSGAPGAGADQGGALTAGEDAVEVALRVDGRQFRGTFVDVGNPHCVVQVDDPATFDVAGVGPLLEHHPAFPNRANVEFVHVEADGSVRMRVWERGVGETQACGTGATAVGAAMVRLGLAASSVLVHLLGGDLTIEVDPWSAEDDAPADGAAPRTRYHVFMTGPAEEVFTCDLSTDLLHRLGWSTAAR